MSVAVANFVLGLVGTIFGIPGFVMAIVALVKMNRISKQLNDNPSLMAKLDEDTAGKSLLRPISQAELKLTIEDTLKNVVQHTKSSLLYGDINPSYSNELMDVLPHFHAIVAMCVAGGLIQCVLTIDMVFDWGVALNPTDEEAKLRCFHYYYQILNSVFVPVKATVVTLVVIVGSWHAYQGGHSLDAKVAKKTGIKVSTSFHFVLILYSVMISLYGIFVVPKYSRFVEALHPGLEYNSVRNTIFEGWLVVLIVRFFLMFLNLSAIAIELSVLPKLIINLNQSYQNERTKRILLNKNKGSPQAEKSGIKTN